MSLKQYVDRRRHEDSYLAWMLRRLYNGYAADPVPPAISDILDRMK